MMPPEQETTTTNSPSPNVNRPPETGSGLVHAEPTSDNNAKPVCLLGDHDQVLAEHQTQSTLSLKYSSNSIFREFLRPVTLKVPRPPIILIFCKIF